MGAENLFYTLNQVIHNLNGALLLGLPLCWLWHTPQRPRPRQLLQLLTLLWLIQAVTGAVFGVVSYAFYSALPDLHPIAYRALAVKLSCVIAALTLCLWLLLHGRDAVGRTPWAWLAILAATAQSAAAVLRWNA